MSGRLRAARSAIARRVAAALCLLSAAAVSVGCEVVFGLGDYSLQEGSGADGGGSGGSATVGWQSTACKPRLPEVFDSASANICRARALTPLDTANEEISPSAYCGAFGCFVYFERRDFNANTDTLMCASCNDIGKLDCDPAVPVAANVINPYFRALTPEVWASKVPPGGSDYDIHVGQQVSGCAPLTAADFAPLPGAVSSSANEIYPAISPDQTTLYFTRCTAGGAGGCKIYVSHREAIGNDFPDGVVVDSIRAGLADTVMDLNAQPIWVGGHGVSALYFSSTRLAATVTDAEQLDVFVATRDGAAAWDAPFARPRVVRQISGRATDFAPVPVLPQYWLQSRKDPNGNMDLYLLDVGCANNFSEPVADAFAAIDGATTDETAPTFVESTLFVTRTSAGADATLMQAGYSQMQYGGLSDVSAFEIDHAAGTADGDPAPSRDGRLLFASTRGGLSKIYAASPTGAPMRATLSADADEETTPFVDAIGRLWLALKPAGQMDGVIAMAERQGDGWGLPSPVPGLGHQAGQSDSAPRLTEDGRWLYFTSTREGGFFPGKRSIWAATRAQPTDDWEPANIALVSELSGMTESIDAWPAQDGCKVTLALEARLAAQDGWSWDIQQAGWSTK